MNIALPYGRGTLAAAVPDSRINAVLRGRLEEYVPSRTDSALIDDALNSPIGSPTLAALAQGKRHIVIILSDHTRPVPSKLLLPPMLREIRRGNPAAEITLLVATGCHRGTTREEMIAKCGEDIVSRERIVIHDCDDKTNLVPLGTLPSGGALIINRLAAEADLLVAEGFIEPHFFAGYSGGRKSVLPGIASRATVLANHNAAFLSDPSTRAGILDGNPIHRDMLYAARKANLSFIANVVINARYEVVAAFAGDADAAHRRGTDFLSSLCAVSAVRTPITVTTNNGFPLDQNLYQSVKGMSAAETLTRDGGVIIMASACSDGCGGDAFLRFFRDTPDAAALLHGIEAVPADQTTPDQWQAQVFARILAKKKVVFISEADDDLVRAFGMLPARDFTQALTIADSITGADAKINVIPEGISVIAEAI
ncbi:MAG: nickel-dependent lactate racemase [Clostridiaceae bacterium]|nr:nickel-dependent lactate racemase [Clostridiaceae bacterium]